MTKVNMVYDCVYDHADIVSVPDEIVSNIEDIGQEFLFWVPYAEDSDYWVIINNEKCAAANTDGFIKWLNSYYCQNLEKAYVVARNVPYCPEYRIVEF